MSDHDTLPVWALMDKLSECDYEGMTPRETADALLAEGWRPPARVITTAEARDALPAGCMVKQLATGTIFRRTSDFIHVPRPGKAVEVRHIPGDWYDANGNCCFYLDLPHYPTIDLPLEVVWLPTKETIADA